MLDANGILPPDKLLVPDARTDATLEALQSSVVEINLKSNIPESVKNEFQRAKDLIIFSFFKYEFLTLAARSAVFAYEAALKLGYVQALGNKAILKRGSEIIQEFTNPSYREISESMQRMKKSHDKSEKITVNDTYFPKNMDQIEKWLIKDGMSESQLLRREAGMYLRNRMAHTEELFILPFCNALGALRASVHAINNIFEHYPSKTLHS
ncbi:MAG: hypothetical protein EB828_04520 [Nitrosopumilus sp. D6]|nr:MAG: hypothetical protein EB828_04520 [Nitrosopumilus sp. D6]